MAKLKLSLCLLFSAYLINTVVSNKVFDDKLLRPYIKSINDQLDVSVKPCDNFGKYACGKLQRKRPPKETLLELANRFLIEETPRTVAEERTRDFYLSCKNSRNITKLFTQVDSLKMLKEWPVQRDFNREEIAELMGKLASLGSNGIIDINVKNWHKDKFKLEVGNTQRDSIDAMIKVMKEYGASAEDIVATAKSIENVMDHIDNALKDKEKIDADKPVSIPFNKLKETVEDFEWDSFFNAYNSELNLNMEILEEKYIEIPKIKSFKEVINCLKTTSSRPFVNYITWKYIQFVIQKDCEEHMYFFYPVLILNLLNEQMVQNDINTYLAVLDRFHVTFEEVRNTFNNPTKIFINNIHPRQNIYRNYRTLGSSKILENVYKQFRMHPNAFYQNIIDIVHTSLSDYLKNGANSTFESFRSTWNSLQTTDIDLVIKNQPLLYYFINVNHKLWTLLTSIDNPGKNRAILPDCMPYQNKMDPRRKQNNLNYVNMYIGGKMALKDFMGFLKDNQNLLRRSNEVLKGFNLNYQKAYHLALAQQRCLENETNDLDNDDLLSYFKQSKEFLTAFECNDNDAMYDKVCEGPSSFQSVFYFES